MTEKPITLHRETMKIEGDRNLYSFTFTDSEGKLLEPEPSLKAEPKPAGNLNSNEGEDRKG